MASEKMFAAPPVASLRKIMKPVISTDVMGNRNVEVKAVGARAEPAALHLIRYGDPGYSQAVVGYVGCFMLVSDLSDHVYQSGTI